MPQIIFAFTFNPGTKEAGYSGNVDIQVAHGILTDILISEMVRRQLELLKAEEVKAKEVEGETKK